jgi:hypothetical protein
MARVGAVSDGTGDASAWLRCAEKSFCRVFSAFNQHSAFSIIVRVPQGPYRVLNVHLVDCRGNACACDCPSRCSSPDSHSKSPSHCVARNYHREFAASRPWFGERLWATGLLALTRCSWRRREASRQRSACVWSPLCRWSRWREWMIVCATPTVPGCAVVKWWKGGVVG